MLTEDRPAFRAVRTDTFNTGPSSKDGNVIRTWDGAVAGLPVQCNPG